MGALGRARTHSKHICLRFAPLFCHHFSCCCCYWPLPTARIGFWVNWNDFSSVSNFHVVVFAIAVIFYAVFVVNKRFHCLPSIYFLFEMRWMYFGISNPSKLGIWIRMTWHTDQHQCHCCCYCCCSRKGRRWFFTTQSCFSITLCTLSGLKKTMPWAVIFKSFENQIKINTSTHILIQNIEEDENHLFFSVACNVCLFGNLTRDTNIHSYSHKAIFFMHRTRNEWEKKVNKKKRANREWHWATERRKK